MKKWSCLFATTIFSAAAVFSQIPGEEVFTVIRSPKVSGPAITPLLLHQTALAWRQDEARSRNLEKIKSERELLALQDTMRSKLLDMIGGLPTEKTPLRAQVLGKIVMQGFHIEKVVFESMPGFHVTALVYVPHNGATRHPGVLVGCGHSPLGKIYYQALCQRLVKRGYVVICWDPVGQAERSQFWDTKAGKSKYNLVCGEHAVLGNLAYLAGANLIRWQIWDGIRALDYLLTRDDVDSARISITGTSGGGVQAAYIGALDKRIKVVVPSCFISSLPMRAYNRIFADPDSDPEQDPFGMISEGIDHAGLLLLVYPRPVLIASAVLDFFPIEGTRKTFREISDVYERFGKGERAAMVEGYHKHQFSLENQEAALRFLDRFNNMPLTDGLPAVSELKPNELQCTKSGQVLTEYPDGKKLTSLIKDYFVEHQQKKRQTISARYFGDGYPNIRNWSVSEHRMDGESDNVGWKKMNRYEVDGIVIDHYVLRHSNSLQIPLIYFHSAKNQRDRVLLQVNLYGKAGPSDWRDIAALVKSGENVISFDFRGTGEDRMNFQATPSEYLKFAQMDSTQIYFNPLSGVFANYVYNSLLTGRPYFLQMIEDAEIAGLFIRSHLKVREISVAAGRGAEMVAREIAETLPGMKFSDIGNDNDSWSEIIKQEREVWPIHNLLPGAAYLR